jgi:hypothetical protein
MLALGPSPARLILLTSLVLAVLATPGNASARSVSEPPSSVRLTPQSLHLVQDPPLVPAEEPGSSDFLTAGSKKSMERIRQQNQQRQDDSLDRLGMGAYLIYYALTRGTVHGVMLWGTLAFAVESDALALAIILLGPTLETGAAFLLLSSEGMTPGKAHLIGTAVDFGAILGLALVELTQVSFDWDRPEESTLAFGLPLVLSLGGAVLGTFLVDTQGLTWGDMELVTLSGLIGGLTGGAVLASGDTATGVGVVLGSVGGLALGRLLIRERDFGVGQAVVMDVSAVLAGLGGALAATALGAEDRGVAIVGGASAAVGMGLSYLLLSPHAVSEEQESDMEISLQLAPGALMARDARTGRPAPTSLLLSGRF